MHLLHLFFLYVNNNNMKKVILISLLLIFNKVYAINEITINDDELCPKFDSKIKVYNYYTDKDKVKIKIDGKDKELLLENAKNKYIIDDYEINIFKNYNKDSKDNVYLTNLRINNHDIIFNKDKYEYFVEIKDEDNLNIDYELSNDEAYVSIIGNGNFNKNDNVITINVNNEYNYIIHALKKIEISKTNENKKNNIVIKKEIAKYGIITISCVLIFLFVYIMFNKTNFYI